MAKRIIRDGRTKVATTVSMGDLAFGATHEIEVLCRQALLFRVDINDGENLINFMTLASSVIRRTNELNGMLMEMLTDPGESIVKPADEHWQRVARGITCVERAGAPR